MGNILFTYLWLLYINREIFPRQWQNCVSSKKATVDHESTQGRKWGFSSVLGLGRFPGEPHPYLWLKNKIFGWSSLRKAHQKAHQSFKKNCITICFSSFSDDSFQMTLSGTHGYMVWEWYVGDYGALDFKHGFLSSFEALALEVAHSDKHLK